MLNSYFNYQVISKEKIIQKKKNNHGSIFLFGCFMQKLLQKHVSYLNRIFE